MILEANVTRMRAVIITFEIELDLSHFTELEICAMGNNG